MNEKEIFEREYVPGAVRIGRVILVISLLVFFVPFAGLWVLYGIEPRWPEILRASFARILINAPWWVMEPLSYFPILGIPGTFISFLAGNGSNMRIPCAIAAQKAANTQPGTVQGQLIATVGVCVSVFVNVAVLALGVALGVAVLSALPQSVTDALNFLLPALYGCVFAQFLRGNEFSGAVAVGLALAALFMYRAGWFAWFPIEPSIMTMLIPIAGTMGLAYLLYRNKPVKAEDEKEE